MSENTTQITLTVTEEDAGKRLDAVIAATMGDLSRTRIKRWIEDGRVNLNAKAVTKTATKLKQGDVITTDVPPAEEMPIEAENIALDILFEDDDILIINKQMGLVSHPAPGNWSGTLVNAVLYHCKDSLKGIGDVKRPGIVHRLDKDTTGVMVVAKTQAAHDSLSAQFKDHGKTGALKRRYACFVWGTPNPKAHTISAPIGRDGHNRTKMCVGGTSERHAVSHYELQTAFRHPDNASASLSHVSVTLETGRTHQVRVHMDHIGHPLLGDPIYGARMKSKVNLWHNTPVAAHISALTAQALHAEHLTITHPRTHDVMGFDAPLPPHLQDLLHTLNNL